MYSLSVANEADERLDITASNNYDILSITGLSPASAAINTAELAGYDGSLFSSSRTNARNIVINLCIHENIEANRIELYRYFRTKEPIRIYYKNSFRNVYIDGYVESFECDFFSMSESCQISVICPQPYFIAAVQTEKEITFHESLSLFEFPFEIPQNKGIEFSESTSGYYAEIQGGDVPSGLIITISATKNASYGDRGRYITITNETSKTFMTIYVGAIPMGGELYINTYKGNKQIYKKSDGEMINKIPDMTGQWIKIQPGYNKIVITDNSGREKTLGVLKIKAVACEYYEGV